MSWAEFVSFSGEFRTWCERC